MYLGVAVVLLMILLAAFGFIFVIGVGLAAEGMELSDLFERDEPKTPKELKPLIKPQTNRDFVIEMLKLRKKTLKEIGYDPFCSLETAEEIATAERVATALEFLVNKYPDPDGFNRALTSTGLISYVTKFNTNKEN